MPQSQFTPPMHPDDEMLFPPTYDDRDRSHTPPMFAYPTYPPPEDVMMAPYGSPAAPYHHRPMAEAAYPDWTTATVPVTLPSMTHFSDAIKRESFEESLSPYVNYGFISGMEMNAAAYDHHSNPNVSSLRRSNHHSHPPSQRQYPTPPPSYR